MRPAYAVVSSASAVELAPENTRRAGLWIFNSSTSVLRIGIGFAPSATLFNVELPAGGFWELPARTQTGQQVQGIWATANGRALVTEIDT